MKSIVQKAEETSQKKLDRMSDRLQAALQQSSEKSEELKNFTEQINRMEDILTALRRK